MTKSNNPFTGKLIKFLGSLKLSFPLILVLGALVSQKAILAQKAFMPKEGEPNFLIKTLNALGITSVETVDTLLYLVLAVFIINLCLATVSMSRRVLAKQRALKSFKTEEGIRALENNAEFELKQKDEGNIVNYLKYNGYRLRTESTVTQTLLYACKRDSGRWGILFFHLTFFILFVGIVLSILTRHAGYFEISPGESFIEKQENYLKKTDKPVLLGENRMFKLLLQNMDLSFWRPGVVKQRASIVQVFDREGNYIGKTRIQINKPLSIEGTKIYQGTRQGFVAYLEVVDIEGTKSTGTVRFRLPEQTNTRMLNAINLPGTSLKLEFELFTEKLGQIEGLEQLGARSMATLMKVTSVERHRNKFQGVVFLGQSLEFEGLKLHFISLKPYTSFVAVRDYGIPVIFISFIFLLIGLVVTYFWVPENYWVFIKKGAEKNIIVIGATTERYKDSFKDRFKENMEELKKKLSEAR